MDYEMTIGKKVSQPFLISSEEALKLLRNGKARIKLSHDGDFDLIISDEEDE